jgi:hypothetical protein
MEAAAKSDLEGGIFPRLIPLPHWRNGPCVADIPDNDNADPAVDRE